MKRFLSFLVSLAMLLALAAPALAAETPPEPAIEDPAFVLDGAAPAEGPASGEAAGLDQALTDVTLKVKEALAVDDGYTEFYGDLRDGVSPRWSLNWSDDVRSLSVEADESGKVMTVYRWHSDDSSDQFYGFDPAFPALERDEAAAQAEDWLTRLMGEGETARIESTRAYLGRNGYYRFSGTVDMNGLPSPVTFNLEVDGNGIYTFDRSDAYSAYVGEMPSEKPEADAQVGADGLSGAISLELYYVSDGEGNARLRYVPVGPYTVVDAITGEAVDMDALYDALSGGSNGYGPMPMAEASAAMDTMGADKSVSLTETELASIENYAGAMGQDELDGALRAIAALGLDGFALQRCSYSVDSETGDITAALRYTKEMTGDQLYGYTADEFAQAQQWGESLTITKYISADAKTGTLESVSTSYPLWQKDETIVPDEADTRDAAEAFLAQAAPDLFPETEPNSLTQWSDDEGFLYVRVHDGYPFPENYLRAELNPATGTVDSYGYEWDEDMTFAPSEGIIGADEAKAAYAGALDAALGYVAWPVDVAALDGELYALYQQWGYTYVEELRLAYFYDGLDEVSGVDALTGEPVSDAANTADSYEYSDLEGVEEKDMIEALGVAGVGFEGGEFKPGETLIQRDAVTLLLRAGGNYSGVERDDGWLGERAVWNGFVAKGEWEPDAPVTEMGFVKMIVGASRYGDAAKLLSGEDTDDGYTAIAQALGLIGDEAPEDGPITRAAAARILYTFMDR